MLPIEENFILNLAASCTREQAVWRMLGWERKTIGERSVEIPITENGIVLQDTQKTYHPDWSLEEHLSRIYKEALTSYSNRLDANSTEDEIEEALGETWSDIERVEVLIEKARGYLLDIVDELAKGDQSALRVDRDTTLKTGVEHITIRSLDAWHAKTYFEAKEIHVAPVIEEEKFEKSEMSLLITLHLLVNLCAPLKRKLQKSNGTPNQTGIAKEIEKMADAYCREVGDFEGQGFKSVVGRLQQASKAMNVKLTQLRDSRKLR